VRLGKFKALIIVALFLYCVIIILPPLIHGYVYPNIGTDTAMHMNQFDEMVIGKPIPSVLYFGYYVVGYPLDVFSQMFDMSKDTMFFWFNYLVLLGVGLTLFFVFKRLVGTPAGLLALILPTFASFSILLLFYSGVIFNIINMAIILPFYCYCLIQWLVTNQRKYAIGAICLITLFSVFHSTGIYTPIVCMVSFVLYVLYKRREHEPISKRFILVLSAISMGEVALFVVLNCAVVNVLFDSNSLIGISGVQLLQESLLHYMSPIVVAIIALSLMCLVDRHKLISERERLTIIMFGLLVVPLLIVMMFGWSPQPFRQGYDFAILLSMVAVALVGIVIRVDKRRVMTIILVVLVIVGASINVGNWMFGYNSALEKVDIQAINYINGLSGDYYSCSKSVDHWIYDRYVDKGYLPSGGTIVVVRNEPMKSIVHLDEETVSLAEREFITAFVDNESGVEIIIYR